MTTNGNSTFNGHGPNPTVDVRRERKYRPVAAGTFHILTRITAPVVENPDRERPPLDLSFVVDRSGSMGGGKLELAKQATEHALRLLDERDSVSLVVYDDQVDTLLTQRLFDRDAHRKASQRLSRVGARGSTALTDGWMTGCRELAPIADGTRTLRGDTARSLCRTILLTDGLANVGITDPNEIAEHVGQLHQRGISTTTIGVGNDYNEELLGMMADAGGGHFHHVERAQDLKKVFAGELGELLQVSMRDASIAIRVPAGWDVRLLNDLPIDRTDGWLTLRLGELASREERSLVWTVELPEVDHGRREEIDICLRWTDEAGMHTFEHAFSHTVEASLDPGEPDEQVQDALAEQLGAQARAEAIRLNRIGNYSAASQVAFDYAAAMPPTMAGQAAARALMHEVAPSMARPASPGELKRQFAQSRNARRSRKDYTDR